MSTATSPRQARSGGTRSMVTKMTVIESKLISRDGVAIFFGLVFPALLLVALAFVIPGFRDPVEEMGGLRAVDVYGPTVIGLAIVTVALTILPAYLTTYRETGVLRRLATTPASPSTLLNAQLIVNLVLLTAGTLLAIFSAVLIFDVDWPGNIPGLVVAFLLGTVASFALGLVIAAVAKNARVASGLGMVLYFPMLFFAGVWTPGDAMPDALRTIADFTPTGAAAEAMTDAWLYGDWPTALHMIVLAGWAVVASAAAAKLFRWE